MIRYPSTRTRSAKAAEAGATATPSNFGRLTRRRDRSSAHTAGLWIGSILASVREGEFAQPSQFPVLFCVWKFVLLSNIDFSKLGYGAVMSILAFCNSSKILHSKSGGVVSNAD